MSLSFFLSLGSVLTHLLTWLQGNNILTNFFYLMNLPSSCPARSDAHGVGAAGLWQCYRSKAGGRVWGWTPAG